MKTRGDLREAELVQTGLWKQRHESPCPPHPHPAALPSPLPLFFPGTLSKPAWQKLERKESTFVNNVKTIDPVEKTITFDNDETIDLLSRNHLKEVKKYFNI